MSGIKTIVINDEVLSAQGNPAETNTDGLSQSPPFPSTERGPSQPYNRYAFNSLQPSPETDSGPSSSESETPLTIASSLMRDQIEESQIEFLSEFLNRPENERYKVIEGRMNQLIAENYCDEDGNIKPNLYRFAIMTQLISWDILLEEATKRTSLSRRALEDLLNLREAIIQIQIEGLINMSEDYNKYRSRLLMMEAYFDIFSTRIGIHPALLTLIPDQESLLQIPESELDARITFMRACRESSQKISEVDPSNKFDFLKPHQEKFGCRRLSNIAEQRKIARADYN